MVESTDKGLPSLGDLEHPLRGATLQWSWGGLVEVM